MRLYILILMGVVSAIALTGSAQRLEKSFCGLHLGCSISEAKTVMTNSVLMSEEDGFVKGTKKLIYNGNIQQAGVDRTTLTFFRGALMDVHLDYAPPYDSLTIFKQFKEKLEKKFGRMDRVDPEDFKFFYEVKTEGMKVELLWTENPDGAKFIGATHLALLNSRHLALEVQMGRKAHVSDVLGDF